MLHGCLVLHRCPELQCRPLHVLPTPSPVPAWRSSPLLSRKKKLSIAQFQLQMAVNPLWEPTHTSRSPARRATSAARSMPAPAPVYPPVLLTRGPFSHPMSLFVTLCQPDLWGPEHWMSPSRIRGAWACTAGLVSPARLLLSSARPSLRQRRALHQMWDRACSSRPSWATLTAERVCTPSWAACMRSLCGAWLWNVKTTSPDPRRIRSNSTRATGPSSDSRLTSRAAMQGMLCTTLLPVRWIPATPTLWR